MDERLDAGRHHLFNGDQAFHAGYLDDARSHFGAALLQFCGPELRMGEGHARRGLAQVEMGCGNLAEAELCAREASACYRDVVALLDRYDSIGAGFELRQDAREGEAVAQTLLGEVLARAGRRADAKEAFTTAQRVYDAIGAVPSSAALGIARARLAMREGRLDDTHADLDSVDRVVAASGDSRARAQALLTRGEAFRLQARLPEAIGALEQVGPLAALLGDRVLQARGITALGSALVQAGRHEGAAEQLRAAVELARKAGDSEGEAYALLGLGDARSRQGLGADEYLLEAARLFSTLGHAHALAGVCQRLAEHAIRIGRPDAALVAAESARRLWRPADQVAGVGQALRLLVKSFAAFRQMRAVILTAFARAAVAGSTQPNAIAVRDHYWARSPERLREQLAGASVDELNRAVDRWVEHDATPILGAVGLDLQALGDPRSIHGTLELLLSRDAPVVALPTPAQPLDQFDLMGPTDEVAFHVDEGPDE